MADRVEIELEVLAKKALDSVEKFSKQAQDQLDGINLNTTVSAINAGFELLGKIVRPVFNIIEAGFSKSAEQALEAEKATIALANALRVSGEFSADAVRQFEDLAAAIQKTTTVTDEAVLGAVTLAKSYGLSNTEAKNVIKVATDLSARLGIDLNSATEKVAKTMTGFVDRDLGRMIGGLKGLSKEQLIAGEGLKLIQDRVKGSAEALSNSFGGALQQAKNSFNEVFEQFGKAVISAPEFTRAIKSLAEQFATLAVEVARLAPDIAIITGEIIRLSLAAVTTALKIEKFAFQVIAGIKAFIGSAVSAIGGLLDIIPGFIDFLVFDVDRGVKKISESLARLNPANFFKSAAAASGQVAKTFDPFIDASKRVQDALAATGKSAETFNKKLGVDSGAAAAIRKSALEREKVESDFQAKKIELEKLGLTEIQKLNLDFAKQKELINKAAAFGFIKSEEAKNKLLLGLEKDQIEKIRAIREKENQKFATGGLGALIGTAVKGQQITKENTQAAAVGFTATILKGAEGAKQLVASTIGAVADAIIPGIGGVVSEIIGVLAQGPEKVKEMVTSFAKSLPDIIKNIVQAIPALIEALVTELPPALAKTMPFVALNFAESLIKNMPKIVAGFAKGLVDAAKAFVDELIHQITTVGGLFGGGNGGAIGSGGFLKGDITVGRVLADAFTLGLNEVFGNPFGFADGGRIPDLPQFNNDRFPARLSAGEQVLSKDLSSRLDSFLSGSGNQPSVIQVNIGQRELARVLLDLNRNGFRTA